MVVVVVVYVVIVLNKSELVEVVPYQQTETVMVVGNVYQI